MTTLEERARAWLSQDPDPVTRDELEAIVEGDRRRELEERFAGRLEFGTAGLRGILGAGPRRMNRVVVMQTSAGLAAYLAAEVERARERGVVVGYDGRKMSRCFAEDTARVLLGAGFRVLLTTTVVPTPIAAFAVLDRSAAGGVMITASHNPPEYNGYKVYWENGAQIIPPHDAGIAERISAVGPVGDLPLGNLAAARESGALVDLDDDLVARYLDGVDGLRRERDLQTPLRVAYTPLHGVGAATFARAAERLEGCEVHIEPSQAEPDGEFPTVRFPNPEEAGAMDRVFALATGNGAELVLANDPDADRLAVAIPAEEGYQMLTGDQVGVLLADYLLEESSSERRLVATTLVSSQLLEHIAAARGVDFRVTLTGFKWIANAALEHRAAHGSRFVFGYEEALGYSVGELVRDKDGISAAILFCDLAAREKKAGRSVRERLDAIYRRHGVYVTRQHSLVLPGLDGAGRIRAHMDRFRNSPPKEIGGRAVVESHDIAEGALGLPPSDVLVFKLDDGARVIMRPSGTEPKLKCYYEVREAIGEDETVGAAMARAQKSLADLESAHLRSIEEK